MADRITASLCFDIINNAKDFAPLAEDQVQLLVLAAAQYICAENGEGEIARKLAAILRGARTSRDESVVEVAALF